MLITEAAARQGVRGIDARVASASRDVAGRGMTSFQGDVVRKARTARMKATLQAYFSIVDRDSSTCILMLYPSPMPVTPVRIIGPTLEGQRPSAGWQLDQAERCPTLHAAVVAPQNAV